MLLRLLYLGIGFYVYILSQLSLLFLVSFTGNIPRGLGMDRAVETPVYQALLIDLLLICFFGAQHSIMARSYFKKKCRSFIPRPLERTFYCLVSSSCLLLLIGFWQPLPGYIWRVESHLGQSFFYFFFFLGWLIMYMATILINHWDLFGLRQVYLFWKRRPYAALLYRHPFLYKKLRHPLYLGFLIAFWSSPAMSVTHFVFAAGMTCYILLGIQWEEQDLVRDFGEIYLAYKKRVPKLFPKW